MAFLAIPTKTDGTASYVVSVQLDAVYYTLHIDWNDRAQRWYLTLNDAQDTLIVGAMPLLVGMPLLRGTTTNQARPPGDFFVYDTTGLQIEAGLRDLGSRCILFYVTGDSNPSL